MASIEIVQWLWEASMEPLADDAKAAADDSVKRLSRLASQIEPLRGLSLETGRQGAGLLYAANRRKAHNLEIELRDDLVAYHYVPAVGVDADVLAEHLRTVAEPVVRSMAEPAWFAARVSRLLITYDLTVIPRAGHRGGGMQRLIAAMAPTLATRATAMMDAVRPVVAARPKQIGLKFTCAARLPEAQQIDVSIELFGSGQNAINASVLLFSREETTPRAPWLSNAGALHQKLWPAIERFFVSLEEHGQSQKGTNGARKDGQRKASPRKASPRKASPRKASPRKASPRKASPRKASQSGARRAAGSGRAAARPR